MVKVRGFLKFTFKNYISLVLLFVVYMQHTWLKWQDCLDGLLMQCRREPNKIYEPFAVSLMNTQVKIRGF